MRLTAQFKLNPTHHWTFADEERLCHKLLQTHPTPLGARPAAEHCVLRCARAVRCAPRASDVVAVGWAVEDFNGRVKVVMKRCNNRAGACLQRWALRFQLMVLRAEGAL
eukprot:5913303-Alexandrium_andersonii.AAC.1